MLIIDINCTYREYFCCWNLVFPLTSKNCQWWFNLCIWTTYRSFVSIVSTQWCSSMLKAWRVLSEPPPETKSVVGLGSRAMVEQLIISLTCGRHTPRGFLVPSEGPKFPSVCLSGHPSNFNSTKWCLPSVTWWTSVNQWDTEIEIS